MNLNGKRIIVSRTDSIGDVMLTLPICHWLKDQFPTSTIIFLGKNYTKSVVDCYDPIDEFSDWGEIEKLAPTARLNGFSGLGADAIIHVFPHKEIASLARKAKISVRIGTSHRLYHLLTCTHRVNFTRRKSDLHESQLNFELLRPLGLREIPSLDEITNTTNGFNPKKQDLPSPFDTIENFVILHPKSQGSAREWSIDRYMDLALQLADQGTNVVFTGTENEGLLFREEIPNNTHMYDSTGKLSLPQLITLIGRANGLVACSTGPLHIAGYCGIRTVGLFSPEKPIHPGRWKALGKDVIILEDTESRLADKSNVQSMLDGISTENVFTAITA